MPCTVFKHTILKLFIGSDHVLGKIIVIILFSLLMSAISDCSVLCHN